MNLLGRNTNVVKIGIWGPPKSGKTAYIAMLQYDDCDGWKLKPRGEETQDIYLEYSEELRDKLRFVNATVVGKISFLTFDFEGPGIFRSRQFRVVLPEAAGEYYSNPKERPELLNELARYHGILWLIDPQRIDKPSGPTYRRMVQEWLFRLHELQGGGTLHGHMAICLTKMDLPQYSPNIGNPREFCLDKLGSDVEKFLSDYCDPNRVEFFATSAIGCNPATGESNIDPSDSTKLRFPAQPLNLFQPFSWLFDNIR